MMGELLLYSSRAAFVWNTQTPCARESQDRDSKGEFGDQQRRLAVVRRRLHVARIYAG